MEGEHITCMKAVCLFNDTHSHNPRQLVTIALLTIGSLDALGLAFDATSWCRMQAEKVCGQNKMHPGDSRDKMRPLWYRNNRTAAQCSSSSYPLSNGFLLSSSTRACPGVLSPVLICILVVSILDPTLWGMWGSDKWSGVPCGAVHTVTKHGNTRGTKTRTSHFISEFQSIIFLMLYLILQKYLEKFNLRTSLLLPSGSNVLLTWH